jgi:hypothetical protein
MKRFLSGFVGLLVASALGSCGSDNNDSNPIGDLGKNLCGLTCPDEGIDDGNASISGTPEIDAFFGAVLNFESAANGVSDGIQGQLNAIKADFGIDGKTKLADGLKAQFDANLEAGIKVDYQPAQCSVDAQATLEASAKCDASVMGGKAEVECKGSCEVEASASASCDANADLYCTVTAPSVKCEGECQGSCDVELTAAAKCEGTCNGSCDGTCSAYSDKEGTKCAGTCSGMCKGTCSAEIMGKATCMGSCRGECTAKPGSAGCEGAVHAECRAHADASIMCSGGCTGDFEPPKVKAECEATAKAQASVNVQCTPPQLAVHYGLKADADVKFQAALKSLIDVRLPALYQAVGKANVVAKAGDSLGVAASGAVMSAANTLKTTDNVKIAYGVGCAIDQLPKAKRIVSDAASKLNTQLMAAGDVSKVIGIGG